MTTEQAELETPVTKPAKRKVLDKGERIQALLGEIALERVRQTRDKGYSAAHDDAHTEGEIARAAAVYTALDLPAEKPEGYIDWLMEMWPWTGHEPTSKGHRANLVRAAALIVAEMERLDRAETPA